MTDGQNLSKSNHSMKMTPVDISSVPAAQISIADRRNLKIVAKEEAQAVGVGSYVMR